MVVIIFLALMFGAELGPKADPTTTTYVPRPDWYFFFLFEVLRVMKNVPKFTPMATIGVPTICMILLFLLPFYDRSPERRIERRPVALAAGIATIVAMAYLTYAGANTGSPNSVDMKPPAGPDRGAGRGVPGRRAGRRPVGLPRLPRDRRQRQQRPGPPLTHIGSKLPPAGDRVDAAQPDRADAVVQEPAQQSPQKFNEPRRLPVRAAVASLPGAMTRCRRAYPTVRRPGTLEEAQVRAMFDRIAGRLRPDEHGDDRRAAPPLAAARGRSRRGAARRPGARRRDRHRRSGARARRGGWPRTARWSAPTSPSGCSSWRATKAAGRRRSSRFASRPPTRSRCPFADGGFDAATVGFGARNFSDLARGLREMTPGRAARRPGGGARDHDADAGRRCRLLRAVVRPRRAGAGARRRRPPGVQLPAELGQALPGPGASSQR